jgi:hypothetical protein
MSAKKKDKPNSSSTSRSCSRLAIRLLVVQIAFLLCAPSTQGTQANYKLCFPNVVWFGPGASPPNVNLDVHSDAGWQGAFVYDSPTGTPPDVVVRGIKDNNNLYLSIEGNNLNMNSLSGSPTASLVILTFDPADGNSAHIQRIHVYPVNSTVSLDTPAPVSSFEYWGRGLNGPKAIDAASGLPNWFNSNVRVTYHRDTLSGPFHWYLAMEIPIRNIANTGSNPSSSDQVQVPSVGSFGLYIDVFRVIKVGTSYEFWQTSWPANQPEVGCPNPSPVGGSCQPDTPTQIPNPTEWGTSTFDKSCGGASITAGLLGENIFTYNNPTSKIALNAANKFHAYIQNTSIDASSGTAVPTSANVKATFKIANWGLPSLPSWGLVPTTPLSPGVQPNPTNPTSINATACAPSVNNSSSACILTIGPWTLSATEQTQYNQPNTTHQCIQVQLEPVPGSNTIVLNSVAQRNMDFGNASRFERIAEISAKGYPLPPGKTDQLFDLHVTTRGEVLKPGRGTPGYSQAGGQPPPGQGKTEGKVVSQLTWIARGCRHTGYYMTIKDQTLELCDPVGAFGYVVTHEGTRAVENWSTELIGEGLQQSQENVYQLRIPKDGVATVTTRVEPKEGGVCSRLPGARGSFVVLFGVFAVGLMAYRPWRRKKA